VAEKNRDGEIGQAEAHQEQRVQVAKADSVAVEGENLAKITIANSDADRREKEAEARRKAVAAEKVTEAKALEEAYAAERQAEDARAMRDKATQTANVVVSAEIDKQKVEIDAEAIAEQTRRMAKGEADAIFMKMEAQAKGIYEILSKQAEGFERLVKAAGNNSKDAVMLMIADKLPELVKTQVDAIKNIKIDKVTVWETGNGKDGKTSTANFMQGMLGSIPPLDDVFKSAGLELPDILKGSQKANNPVEDMKSETKS
jgi:flotillin